MGEKLEVDYEELEMAIGQMKSAYEDFYTLTQNAFQTEIGYLDGMNSDFADKLSRVLEIAKGWDIDSIHENIGSHIREAETIYEEIKAADESLAGKQ